MKTFSLTIAQDENIITVSLNKTIKVIIDKNNVIESIDTIHFLASMIVKQLEINTEKNDEYDNFKSKVETFLSLMEGRYQYTMTLKEDGKLDISMNGNASLDVFKYISLIQSSLTI